MALRVAGLRAAGQLLRPQNFTFRRIRSVKFTVTMSTYTEEHIRNKLQKELDAKHVLLHRLFPIARGVFEDKVANVWCVLNVAYKFKTRFCNLDMFRYCTFATLAAVFPSSADLFLRPNVKKFVPALVNSSLAFFLFSFQVHEKSILLAAVPVLLYSPQKPLQCFWFLVVSTFSMLPLFVADGLIVAYVALVGFYVVAFALAVERPLKDALQRQPALDFGSELRCVVLNARPDVAGVFDAIGSVLRRIYKHAPLLMTFSLPLAIVASLAGCAVLSLAMIMLEPPARYPDFYSLSVAAYSCLHFVGFFVYFNVVQLRIPQEFDVKLKDS